MSLKKDLKEPNISKRLENILKWLKVAARPETEDKLQLLLRIELSMRGVKSLKTGSKREKRQKEFYENFQKPIEDAFLAAFREVDPSDSRDYKNLVSRLNKYKPLQESGFTQKLKALIQAQEEKSDEPDRSILQWLEELPGPASPEEAEEIYRGIGVSSDEPESKAAWKAWLGKKEDPEMADKPVRPMKERLKPINIPYRGRVMYTIGDQSLVRVLGKVLLKTNEQGRPIYGNKYVYLSLPTKEVREHRPYEAARRHYLAYINDAAQILQKNKVSPEELAGIKPGHPAYEELQARKNQWKDQSTDNSVEAINRAYRKYAQDKGRSENLLDYARSYVGESVKDGLIQSMRRQVSLGPKAHDQRLLYYLMMMSSEQVDRFYINISRKIKKGLNPRSVQKFIAYLQNRMNRGTPAISEDILNEINPMDWLGRSRRKRMAAAQTTEEPSKGELAEIAKRGLVYSIIIRSIRNKPNILYNYIKKLGMLEASDQISTTQKPQTQPPLPSSSREPSSGEKERGHAAKGKTSKTPQKRGYWMKKRLGAKKEPESSQEDYRQELYQKMAKRGFKTQTRLQPKESIEHQINLALSEFKVHKPKTINKSLKDRYIELCQSNPALERSRVSAHQLAEESFQSLLNGNDSSLVKLLKEESLRAFNHYQSLLKESHLGEIVDSDHANTTYGELVRLICLSSSPKTRKGWENIMRYHQNPSEREDYWKNKYSF